MLWQSDIADEIAKAKRYAQEPLRVTTYATGWTFRGDHHNHFIRFVDSSFVCSCETFRRKAMAGQPWCEHTRAIEMLKIKPESAIEPVLVLSAEASPRSDYAHFAVT